MGTLYEVCARASSTPDGAMALGEFLFKSRQYALIPAVLEPRVAIEGAHMNNFRFLAHSYGSSGF